jgi:LysM repeat protein
MKLLAALLLIALIAGTASAQNGSEYHVRYGDTLDVIAQTHDVSVACLLAANGLTNANQLTFGQLLVIPADCDPYDQIESIIFSNIEDLSDNELLASGLGQGGGAAAAVDEPEADEEGEEAGSGGGVATTAPVDEVYVVQRGDNLTRIAAQFAVTVSCLQQANGILDPDLIYVGQELLISADCQAGGGADVIPGAARQCFGDRNAGRVVRGGTYIVQEGDTLDFIGCDLNLSTRCLAALNDLPNQGGRLQIGQTLTISAACAGWDGPPGPGDLGR